MRLNVYRQKQHLGGYHIGTLPEVRIGRGRSNQIILPDSTVSRDHVRLVRQGTKFLLIDESRNGTWINGKRVNNVRLTSGDEFIVGPFSLQLDKDGYDWDRETEIKEGDVPNIFHGMVGSSHLMRNLFEIMKRVSASEGTVLITGETGTGKELVAKAVHELSPRKDGPFVAINCGAISPELVESELFGHEKGSFTGAVAGRQGAFEQADGGTLFLDEVGELATDLQPKLLRVLEENVIRRVGSQAVKEVDVRVVAATHRDLKEEVEKGSFRADLLYRLFVLPLFVPPLKGRQGDLQILASHFMGVGRELSEEAENVLSGHSWPGNVRELKNVLERACIMRAEGPIQAEDLVFLKEDSAEPEYLPGQSLEDLEKMYYSKALKKTGGSIRAAAKTLGIPKSTFFDKLKKYGLMSKDD